MNATERAKTIEVATEVEHMFCSTCNTQLTHLEDPTDKESKITADMHFDLTRSNKVFEMNGDCVEEDESYTNEKMRHTVCRHCFEKILHESPTLSKLFEVPPSRYGCKWVY